MYKDVLNKTFFHNTVANYLTFLLVLIVSIIITTLLKILIFDRLKKWAEKTENKFDDFLIAVIRKTLLPLLYFGAFYLSTQTLFLGVFITKTIRILGFVLLTILGIRFLIVTIEYAIKSYWIKRGADEATVSKVKGVLPAINVVIWGIGIVFLLDNLGVKISTVVAGLGIGGVAIALASQAILGDLFCYFAILFDHPFEVGDFIIIEDFMGTIEHIGIKSTRIRSLGGEQLVFSNTDLTKSRLRNYKRMEKRRVIFRIGVVYQTSLEKLKEIPPIIRNIITNINDTVFDRVHFFSYGDFSLIYEIVYYVLSNDYNKYMDVQQEINFRIKEEFDKRSIEFAYPTQTLYLSKTE